MIGNFELDSDVQCISVGLRQQIAVSIITMMKHILPVLGVIFSIRLMDFCSMELCSGLKEHYGLVYLFMNN